AGCVGEGPSDNTRTPPPASRLPDPYSHTSALDALQELLGCSLIFTEEMAGAARFRMLETLREFAEESLPKAERDTLRERHFAYFLAVAREAKTRMRGPEDGQRLDHLQLEYENLRAALAWATQQATGSSRAKRGYPALDTRALELASLLSDYWERRGPAS